MNIEMIYVLGEYKEPAVIKELLEMDLRGELTIS